MSIEKSTKSQFERTFAQQDWKLFKEMADALLADAAFLKKSSFTRVRDELKLLARNSRKRLLIGIGVELLLKSVYLNRGYCINKPQDPKSAPKFPFTIAVANGVQLKKDDTYLLGELIPQLKKVVTLREPGVVTDGLNVAKVFRNKEGHVVTPSHQFVPDSYRLIEKSLSSLYADAFAERLTVRFALAPNETAVWKTKALE
jgi:hypothetical protein